MIREINGKKEEREAGGLNPSGNPPASAVVIEVEL